MNVDLFDTDLFLSDPVYKTIVMTVTDLHDKLLLIEALSYVNRKDYISIADSILAKNPSAYDDDCITVENIINTENLKKYPNRFPEFSKAEIYSVANDNSTLVAFVSFECIFDYQPLFVDKLYNYSVKIKGITPLDLMRLRGGSITDILERYPVVAVQTLIYYAYNNNATDLHIGVSPVAKPDTTTKGRNVIDLSTTEKDNQPEYFSRIRRNGIMYSVTIFPITKNLNRDMINFLVRNYTDRVSNDILSDGLTTSVKNAIGIRGFTLRLSICSVHCGTYAVARLQKETTTSLSVEQLGFPQEQTNAINVLANKTTGITLITGAPRTGKNTTANAIANKVIRLGKNIVCYDSPIETLLPCVQIDYMENPNVLLKSIKLAKKQDVEIAFLNEIPTKEVAFAVMDLAVSAIGVITTLHLDRLWELPRRLYEYFGEDYKILLGSINGVVNQKMFSLLCDSCKTKILVETIEDIRIQEILLSNDIKEVFESSSCEECFDKETQCSGFRIGVNKPYAEHLIFTNDVKRELLTKQFIWEVESSIQDSLMMHGTNLLTELLKGIKRGDLHYNSLYSII